MNLKKKITVGVASAALVASMGVLAPVAVADKHSLPGFIGGLGRLSGADRVATSLKVATHEWGKRPDQVKGKNGVAVENGLRKEPAKRVYLASAEDAHMVDAATAGMLLDGPIVYVTNNVYVGTAVGNYLADLETNPAFKNLEEIVPIGGEKAVPKSVAQAVLDVVKSKVNSKAKIGDSLAGKDRYETSVAIAQYIYGVRQNKEHDSYKWYAARVGSTGAGALGMAYFANGADNHIVDSMVAGTLDNGPILLVQPDGKIPESVAEFIKKTLPLEFGALGGTAAVPDSTINEAWVIKALANKWDSSYTVPKGHMSVRELERLVYGAVKDSKDTLLDSPTFGGLKVVIEKAEEYSGTWKQEVRELELAISKHFNDGKDSKLDNDAVKNNVIPLLQKLYGYSVVSKDATAQSLFEQDFLKGKAGAYTGVDYDKIESSKAYASLLKDPKDDLIDMWKGQKQDPEMDVTGILKQDAAKLSQNRADAQIGGTNASEQTTLKDPEANAKVPLKVVYALADLTVKTNKDWFEAAKKQLAQAKGILRGELDKIDSKTVLRLGGKDRYETAQLIANQWARQYAIEMRQNNSGTTLDDKFFETYVASGTRLPDSLTAGQLTRGPIMLVRGDEKNAKELSPFTANVATHLQCWSDKKHTLNLFGVGGKAVLADSSLQAVVDLANTASVCAPEKPAKTITKKLTSLEYDEKGATYVSDTDNNSIDTASTAKHVSLKVAGDKTKGMEAKFFGLPKGVEAAGNPTDGKLTFTPGTEDKVGANGVYPVTVRWYDKKTHEAKYEDTVKVQVKLAADVTTPADDSSTLAKDTTNTFDVKFKATKVATIPTGGKAKVFIDKFTPESGQAAKFTPSQQMKDGVELSGDFKASFTQITPDASTTVTDGKKVTVEGHVVIYDKDGNIYREAKTFTFEVTAA